MRLVLLRHDETGIHQIEANYEGDHDPCGIYRLRTEHVDESGARGWRKYEEEYALQEDYPADKCDEDGDEPAAPDIMNEYEEQTAHQAHDRQHIQRSAVGGDVFDYLKYSIAPYEQRERDDDEEDTQELREEYRNIHT